ncbi:hypothetical protein MesoLj131a_30090 [Mesorhizobium sp. 131-2-1]|nr:hypothetical protein MesoLj131a_30090 [Mesorhizobium sp. 131-2-1]
MLEIEAAQTRHAHIEDKASRAIWKLCIQHCLGRRERYRFNTDRIQQLLQGVADFCVIIHENRYRAAFAS